MSQWNRTVPWPKLCTVFGCNAGEGPASSRLRTNMKAHEHHHHNHDAKPVQAASCCASPSSETGADKVIDPVCGMSIDPKTAAATREHAGTTYYFCNKSCAVKFEAEPERYLKKQAPAPVSETDA